MMWFSKVKFCPPSLFITYFCARQICWGTFYAHYIKSVATPVIAVTIRISTVYLFDPRFTSVIFRHCRLFHHDWAQFFVFEMIFPFTEGWELETTKSTAQAHKFRNSFLFPMAVVSLKCERLTSNDIIAGNGREMFSIKLNSKKCF